MSEPTPLELPLNIKLKLPRREKSDDEMKLQELEKKLWDFKASNPPPSFMNEDYFRIEKEMLNYVGRVVPLAMKVAVLETLNIKTLVKLWVYMLWSIPLREDIDMVDSRSIVSFLAYLQEAIWNRGYNIKFKTIESRP